MVTPQALLPAQEVVERYVVQVSSIFTTKYCAIRAVLQKNNVNAHDTGICRGRIIIDVVFSFMGERCNLCIP